jgi:hypothetical protein
VEAYRIGNRWRGDRTVLLPEVEEPLTQRVEAGGDNNDETGGTT